MDKPTAHEDREHAIYAPSSASRWIACHDSVAASEGIEEESSVYAEEGTECHEAAAAILMGESYDKATADLSDDQLWIVDTYTDYVFDTLDMLRSKFRKVDVWFEERVRSDFNDDYHGTADTVIHAGRTAAIIDLKAGFFPVVPRDPETGKINEQLGSYGILMLDHHELWDKVDKIRLTIVQPRVYEAPQTIVVTIDELRAFKKHVAKHIKQIEQGDDSRNAGKHCKFCPARGGCKALRNLAVDNAKIVFDEPKQARDYTRDELEEILNEAETISAHIEGVKLHVRRELEKGRKFKNWKLVPKRAMSKWTDEDAVKQQLQGYELTAGFNVKLKTPLQLLKSIKEHKMDVKLDGLWQKESSGLTLARMDDPRNAEKHDPFKD